METEAPSTYGIILSIENLLGDFWSIAISSNISSNVNIAKINNHDRLAMIAALCKGELPPEFQQIENKGVSLRSKILELSDTERLELNQLIIRALSVKKSASLYIGRDMDSL